MSSSNGTSSRLKRSRRIACTLCAAVLSTSVLCAQTFSEYRVKAAYLYNFVKLAQWPDGVLPSAPSPLVFCVFGADDDFVEALRTTTAGKPIGERPISVKAARSARELRSCQLVFFRAAEQTRVPDAVASLAGSSALLVGEQEDFLASGGMINLSLEDSKVRFQVNTAALDRARIRYDASFLAMASADTSRRGLVQSAGSRALLSSAPPGVPEVARRMNLAGTVKLQVLVRPDGTVKEVRVLGGHPLLADAAAQAVRQWRYRPGPSETTEVVKISFGP